MELREFVLSMLVDQIINYANAKNASVYPSDNEIVHEDAISTYLYTDVWDFPYVENGNRQPTNFLMSCFPIAIRYVWYFPSDTI